MVTSLYWTWIDIVHGMRTTIDVHRTKHSHQCESTAPQSTRTHKIRDLLVLFWINMRNENSDGTWRLMSATESQPKTNWRRWKSCWTERTDEWKIIMRLKLKYFGIVLPLIEVLEFVTCVPPPAMNSLPKLLKLSTKLKIFFEETGRFLICLLTAVSRDYWITRTNINSLPSMPISNFIELVRLDDLSEFEATNWQTCANWKWKKKN